MEGMDLLNTQLALVVNAFMSIIFKIAIPFAGLRLAWAGLKVLSGRKEEAQEVLKQVGVGLFVIGNSLTIVWLIKIIVSVVSIKPVGW